MTWAPECDVKWDGVAAGILVAAIPLAILVVWLTIVLYRRSVAKAMRASMGEVVSEPTSTDRSAGAPAPLQISFVDSTHQALVPHIGHSRATMRAVTWVYVLAGMTQSVLITVLSLWLNDFDIRPFRTFMVWLPFAWPIILTLTLTATATRKQKYAVIAAYFLSLLVMDASADFFGMRYQPGFGQLFVLWFVNAGVPTVIMVILGNRAWRSIGFIAYFFSIVVVGSLLLGFQGLGCLVLTTRSPTLLSSVKYLLPGLVLFLTAVGWWGFRQLVHRYQAKRYSDQMLVIDSLWLLVTLLETISQLQASGVAGLSFLLAFVAYKAVSMIGLARIRATHTTETPQTLLMLRVFGHMARTRRLTDQVGHYWRYSGPINMIGGTDLATSLIEPDELFQFWSRRLRRIFLANEADIQARLHTLDVGRDPDLRYRINEFFCHDNTWQATVKALAQRSAVVLMDLRGFGKQNRGCEFELEMLLDIVLVSRVVLLVDETTEIDTLRQVLHEAWSKLTESSPNRTLTNPVLSLFQIKNSEAALQPLLSRLFLAANAV